MLKSMGVLKKIYSLGITLVVPAIIVEIVSTDNVYTSQSLTWLVGILAALLLLMMADFVYALEEGNGRSKKSALLRTIATMSVGILCGGLAFLF